MRVGANGEVHSRNEKDQVARQQTATEQSGALATGTVADRGEAVLVREVGVGWRVSAPQ